MTTTAETVNQLPYIANPDMYGANVAFMIVSILTLLGLILSIFIKNDQRPEGEMKEKRPRKVSIKMQE